MNEPIGTVAKPLPDAALTESSSDQGKARLLATGGILGALAASSCCIAPLILFSLGASGAWIGNLAALSPYQPYVVALTAGFLVAGYYLVYRKPKAVFAEGEVCLQPLPRRTVKFTLWTATVMVAVAAAFPYVAPALLGV
jgi:mercuric ion transport protein